MKKAQDRSAGRHAARVDRAAPASLLEALVEGSADGLIATDASGAIRAVSPSALSLLGWTQPPPNVQPWPAEPGLFRDDRSTPLAPQESPIALALRGESGRDRLIFARGPAIPEGRVLRAAYQPLCAEPGQPPGALLILRDVTEELRLRTQLAEHETRMELRAAVMADVTARASVEALIANALERLRARFPGLGAAYGIAHEGHLTVLASRPGPVRSAAERSADLRSVSGYIQILLRDGFFACPDVHREPLMQPLLERLVESSTLAFAAVPVRHSQALRGILWFSSAVPRAWSEHEVATLRMIADYLSLALVDAHREEERRAVKSELEWSVLHDRLTGLANRVLFTDRLEDAIGRARRDPRQSYAVLFLDFDHFKFVNDSLGHEVGDQLLVEISNRLRANLRETDTPSRWTGACLPARLGGDEFVLLLEEISGAEDVERVTNRIQHLLAAPHQVAGHEVTATASIGIVMDDGRYKRAEHVLRDADTAMYHAKQRGKARHVIFDEEMHAAAVRRLTLERELRRAVERGEFVAHYQPIVELRHERIVGFESLLRWKHPERGLVPPGEFIPLAEEIGLVVPMGEWILAESARQLRSWRERFPSLGELSVSVNVSKRQIVHPGLIPFISAVLRDTGLPPRALKLEITESVVMENPVDAAPVLQQIEALGVQLAMDDFGTGHSSLGTLQRFPIHVLKVDRSFVSGLDDRSEYAAITQAIVTLAHSLHMTVVAEGVEKLEHVELLRELECDEAQGFFFARPLPVEGATELLERMVRGGSLRG